MMSVALRYCAAVLVLALTSCGRPSPFRNPHLSSALAKLIPPDTTILLDVNLARLRNTSAYQQYLSQLETANLDSAAKDTGIDPKQDVDEILSCFDGKNMVMLAQGRFKVQDVTSRLHSSGMKATSYDGVDLFGDESKSLAFPDSSTSIAGSAGLLRTVLDQRRNGTGGIPAPLRPLVDGIPTQDQVWAAMAGGLITLPGQQGAMEGNLENLVQLAHSVESASIGLDVQHGLDLQARAECRSEEEGRRVHDALRGFIAIARMSAPANRPDLVKVYDAITVAREKSEVRATVSLNQQDLDAFLKLWFRKSP